jgi:hypothetical protein
MIPDHWLWRDVPRRGTRPKHTRSPCRRRSMCSDLDASPSIGHARDLRIGLASLLRRRELKCLCQQLEFGLEKDG